MRLAGLSLILGGTAALAAGALLLLPERTQAQGRINSGQIRFCENQTERWVTHPAPRDDTFFHQEVALGEGTYSLSMIPNGNFSFNAFVYAGEGNSYVGGSRNVRSHVQNLRVGDWSGEKFLVQLVKTSSGCRGCTVTMVLRARNCPDKPDTSRQSRPPCPVNQCLTDGGIFGLEAPRCVAKPGARGYSCAAENR